MLPANMNAYNQYRTTAVQTASPGKLLLMLYDGLLRFLKQAQQAIHSNDLKEAHTNLIKSQDIFTELMCTLNMDYEISQHLLQLYDYLKQRLVEANLQKDAQIVAEVLNFTQELRDTWVAVVKSGQGSIAAQK